MGVWVWGQHTMDILTLLSPWTPSCRHVNREPTAASWEWVRWRLRPKLTAAVVHVWRPGHMCNQRGPLGQTCDNTRGPGQGRSLQEKLAWFIRQRKVYSAEFSLDVSCRCLRIIFKQALRLSVRTGGSLIICQTKWNEKRDGHLLSWVWQSAGYP